MTRVDWTVQRGGFSRRLHRFSQIPLGPMRACYSTRFLSTGYEQSGRQGSLKTEIQVVPLRRGNGCLQQSSIFQESGVETGLCRGEDLPADYADSRKFPLAPCVLPARSATICVVCGKRTSSFCALCVLLRRIHPRSGSRGAGLRSGCSRNLRRFASSADERIPSHQGRSERPGWRPTG